MTGVGVTGMMTEYSPVDGITIYDNVFTQSKTSDIVHYCSNRTLRIGWEDRSTYGESYVHSPFDKQDLQEIGFFNQIIDTPVMEGIKIQNFYRSILNVGQSGDVHWTHAHGDETVLLYYVNTEWQEHWGGETLFFDAANRDVIFGSRPTPNRIVKFQGGIPHKITPISRSADHKFRFTLSIFFRN